MDWSQRKPGVSMRVLSGLALCLAAVGPAGADQLDLHTFQPPYTYVDNAGNRMASQNWKNGGVTNVGQNFIRLTPDRQSKKGALWSRKALGTETFSAVLKFRISGQGKKFFGDGMAMWVMQQAYYVEGDLHGSVERFTGFGVIFDTFKNTETLSMHRDVSIVVNDGTKTHEVIMDQVQGCDANIRYHEDRDDFSVDSASRAKIVVTDGTKLSVLVDARNTGEFKACAETELPFEPEWARKAHIGITASTGQLADNHDVISLTSFSDLAMANEHEALVATAPLFERASDAGAQDRLDRLEDAVNRVMEKLAYLEHHTEHELLAVEDHIKVATGKLSAQEAISEGRIDELEKKVVSSVNQGVEGRLAELETTLDESLIHRITAVETVLNTKLSESVAATVQTMGGWKLPFLFLLLLFIGGAVGLYQWYKILVKKSHLP